MKNDIFKNISKIIERDSKVTTYKFALLRGVIDIIQDNTPYVTFDNDRVHFPTGLLVEKWLLYYYPILESGIYIPQIFGNGNLAFGVQFNKIITFYSDKGGFSAFYNDLRNRGIPSEIQQDFVDLVKKIRHTVTEMPMRYIGRSITSDYYSIFNFEKGTSSKQFSGIDLEFLIKNLGTFSIPIDYYEAFQTIGSFISGQDSILFKWAEFSVNASGQRLSIESVVNEVLRNPITIRDIAESKQIYRTILNKEGKVHCVWTGKEIHRYDIDHVIPFSIEKNNDLWNLLPAHPAVNRQKRDKIPSPNLVEKRKGIIFDYWYLINQYQNQRFQKEIQVSLLGKNSFDFWQETAIQQLQKKCDYLISTRGYDEWNSK